MKTIHLEITDNLYSKLRKILESFPKDSYQIIEEDNNELSVEEQNEIYRLKQLSDQNDFSEFEDCDDIKEKL